jgi:hypothetical protein
VTQTMLTCLNAIDWGLVVLGVLSLLSLAQIYQG